HGRAAAGGNKVLGAVIRVDDPDVVGFPDLVSGFLADPAARVESKQLMPQEKLHLFVDWSLISLAARAVRAMKFPSEQGTRLPDRLDHCGQQISRRGRIGLDHLSLLWFDGQDFSFENRKPGPCSGFSASAGASGRRR